ncbi:hypothetical protein SAMN05216588_10956 [Pseudomonas flavescens]|uniref:Membrane domain of glycerophosphoryl diester phosphodiesterase n=1 Tax=Phytopseudomonas flavescens TaxID=29435 RepID=A0A1G8GHT5_9GAMM|nr:hypothetical protein [Pseudomonas flavescens]SDH93943.1 hypothetical protein SAMN05216588_10956 [Pseudomonas flavescens]
MSDTLSTNPYAVPTSELQQTPGDAQTPSIEQALSRGYDFSIGALISEAWQLTKGTKGIIIGGFLAFYVVMFVATFIIGAVLGIFTVLSDNIALIIIAQMVTTILASAVSYPFIAGLNMVGIRRAAGQPYGFNEIFSHFGRIVPLLVIALLMMLFIYLGMILLVIPGLYLAVAYMLAIPLVVERGLSPWQAMEASRKAITQHWFKVFGLFLLLGLILAISAIPLFIGLIWTIPLFVMSIGVLYRTIFGVLPVAP